MRHFNSYITLMTYRLKFAKLTDATQKAVGAKCPQAAQSL